MMDDESIDRQSFCAEWPNSAIKNLIDYYEEQDLLWKPEKKDLRNKDAMNKAWKEIQMNLDDDGYVYTIPEIKSKIRNIRTSYGRIEKKVVSSLCLGSEDIYKPSNPLYERLSFLQGSIMPKTPLSTMNTQVTEGPSVVKRSKNRLDKLEVVCEKLLQSATASESSDQICDSSNSIIERLSFLQGNVTPETSISNNNYQVAEGPSAAKRSKTRLDKLEVLCEKLLESANESSGGAFGEYVSEKLNKMEPTQQIYAENLIQEVLFQGALGKLNDKCHVIEGIPVKTQNLEK